MRFSTFLVTLFLAAPALADPRPSDPAFLGVMMDQLSPRPTGCLVSGVTPNSGAEAAGIRAGEVVFKLDDKIIANCQALTNAIVSHAGGEQVTLDLGTDSPVTPHRAVAAVLGSRGETARRALLNKKVDTELVSTEGQGSPLDLAGLKHQVAVVGWFAPNCDCKLVFEKVARWQSENHDATLVYGATYDKMRTLDMMRSAVTIRDAFKLDVPLAIASDPNAMGGTQPSIMFDPDRVMFEVIDRRGNVTYLSYAAPNADDVDAVLDDLFVAVEHAKLRK